MGRSDRWSGPRSTSSRTLYRVDFPCQTCASSSSGRCADHRDPVVFRDRTFITVDIDPITESNIRQDERNRTLDDVIAITEDPEIGSFGEIDHELLLVRIARLRK